MKTNLTATVLTNCLLVSFSEPGLWLIFTETGFVYQMSVSLFKPWFALIIFLYQKALLV